MNLDPFQSSDQAERKEKGQTTQVNKCVNEKRRREQANEYMEELAELISTTLPNDSSYTMIKPDKCHVLQETVQQMYKMKAIRSNNDIGSFDVVQQAQVSSSRPSILASDVVGVLLLEAIDGFLVLVNVEGVIEFVSENVKSYLYFTEEELLGQNIFTFLAPASQQTFSNCLSLRKKKSSTTLNDSFDIDLKSHESISFEVELLLKKTDNNFSNEVMNESMQKYIRMLMVAIYQKSSNTHDSEATGSDYIACIVRKPDSHAESSSASSTKDSVFTTKQDLHGKIMGYSPGESTKVVIPIEEVQYFHGQNILEFCHPNDQDRLRQHHDAVLKNGSNTSGIYRFQIRRNKYVFVQTKSKLFKNPTLNKPEFIMSTHSVIRECGSTASLEGSIQNSLINCLVGVSGAKDNFMTKSAVNQFKEDDSSSPGHACNDMEFNMNKSSTASANSPLLNSPHTNPDPFTPRQPKNNYNNASAFGFGRPMSASSGNEHTQSPGLDGFSQNLKNMMKRKSVSPGYSGCNDKQQSRSHSSLHQQLSPGYSSMSPVDAKRMSLFTSSKQDTGFKPSMTPERPQKACYQDSMNSVFDNLDSSGPFHDLDLMSFTRPSSQGSGSIYHVSQWDNSSQKDLSPLQALEVQVGKTVSQMSDDLQRYEPMPRRRKQDSGSSGSIFSGLSNLMNSQQAGTKQKGADQSLRALLTKPDEDDEDQDDLEERCKIDSLRHSQINQSSNKGRLIKQILNASPPQQPQSTTLDESPESPLKDSAASIGSHSSSKGNKLLKNLLSDDSNAPPPKQNLLAQLEQIKNNSMLVQPDTSTISPKESQKNEVGSTTNSNDTVLSKSSSNDNKLLKQLLVETDDDRPSESDKKSSNAEILARLLSENDNDEVTPAVETPSSTVGNEHDRKSPAYGTNSTKSDTSKKIAPILKRFKEKPNEEDIQRLFKNLWEQNSEEESQSGMKRKRSLFDTDETIDSTINEPVPSSSSASSSSAPAASVSSDSGTTAATASNAASADRPNNKKCRLLKELLSHQPAGPQLQSKVAPCRLSALPMATPQISLNKKPMNAGKAATNVAAGSGANLSLLLNSETRRPLKDRASSDSDLNSLEQATRVNAAVDAVERQLSAEVPSVNGGGALKNDLDIGEENLAETLMGNTGFLDLFFSSNVEEMDLDTILQDVLPNDGDGVGLPGVNPAMPESIDDSMLLYSIEQAIMNSDMSMSDLDNLMEYDQPSQRAPDLSAKMAIDAIQQQLMLSSCDESVGPRGSQKPSGQADVAGRGGSTPSGLSLLESLGQNTIHHANQQQPPQSNQLLQKGQQNQNVPHKHLQELLMRTDQSPPSPNVTIQRQLSSGSQVGSQKQQPALQLSQRRLSSALQSQFTQPEQNFNQITDIGIDNFREMMNVTHAPNRVAPPSQRPIASPITLGQLLNGTASSSQPLFNERQSSTGQISQWTQRSNPAIMAGGTVQQQQQQTSNGKIGSVSLASMQMMLDGGSNNTRSPENIDGLFSSAPPSPMILAAPGQQKSRQLSKQMSIPGNHGQQRETLLSRSLSRSSHLGSPSYNSSQPGTPTAMLPPSMNNGMVSPSLRNNPSMSPSMNNPGSNSVSSPFVGMMSPSGHNMQSPSLCANVGNGIQSPPTVTQRMTPNYGHDAGNFVGIERHSSSGNLISPVAQNDAVKQELNAMSSSKAASATGGQAMNTKQMLKAVVHARSQSQTLQTPGNLPVKAEFNKAASNNAPQTYLQNTKQIASRSQQESDKMLSSTAAPELYENNFIIEDQTTAQYMLETFQQKQQQQQQQQQLQQQQQQQLLPAMRSQQQNEVTISLQNPNDTWMLLRQDDAGVMHQLDQSASQQFRTMDNSFQLQDQSIDMNDASLLAIMDELEPMFNEAANMKLATNQQQQQQQQQQQNPQKMVGQSRILPEIKIAPELQQQQQGSGAGAHQYTLQQVHRQGQGSGVMQQRIAQQHPQQTMIIQGIAQGMPQQGMLMIQQQQQPQQAFQFNLSQQGLKQESVTIQQGMNNQGLGQHLQQQQQPQQRLVVMGRLPQGVVQKPGNQQVRDRMVQIQPSSSRNQQQQLQHQLQQLQQKQLYGQQQQQQQQILQQQQQLQLQQQQLHQQMQQTAVNSDASQRSSEELYPQIVLFANNQQQQQQPSGGGVKEQMIHSTLSWQKPAAAATGQSAAVNNLLTNWHQPIVQRTSNSIQQFQGTVVQLSSTSGAQIVLPLTQTRGHQVQMQQLQRQPQHLDEQIITIQQQHDPGQQDQNSSFLSGPFDISINDLQRQTSLDKRIRDNPKIQGMETLNSLLEPAKSDQHSLGGANFYPESYIKPKLASQDGGVGEQSKPSESGNRGNCKLLEKLLSSDSSE